MEFEVRLIYFPGQLYGSVALLLTDYINIPKLLSIICKGGKEVLAVQVFWDSSVKLVST